MIRYILIFVLTFFQDTYVRMGAFLGLIIGFSVFEILNGNPVNNIFSFGFIGWGIGAYLSYILTRRTHHTRKNIFKVFQGSK